jgi:two-component system, response regulator PdtaR
MMTKPKVLIVEDDRIIAGVARWRLSKLGYDVCGSAATGAEALSYLPDLKPDIVLMDINLQGEIDGIETAGRIKKEFNIPVIFASSHTDEETVSRAKEVNPDGFVKKPFDDDNLRIALELGLKK